jgi:hypothetical protein
VGHWIDVQLATALQCVQEVALVAELGMEQAS